MRRTRLLFLGALVVGLACGEESAPPVPTGMTLTSGNGQSGLPGTQLPLPLTVTVTGTGGAAFPNARVTWTVTAGSASLNPAVDTTDVNGVASTIVNVGTTPGNLVVTATATGVAAVPFNLTTLNPCAITVPGVLTPIDTNGTANGVLTNFDCQLNGPFFTDFYSVVLPAQKGLFINMTATFDTYVELYHPTGAFLGVNDDIDSTNANSRVQIIAGTGTLVLATSSFLGSVTGGYTLAVSPRPQTLTGCRGEDRFLTWITRGVAITDQVETTDCTVIRAGGGRAYTDKVLISLSATRPLNVMIASAAFNPRLELFRETMGGPVFTTAVNGSGGSATLAYTPAADSVYRLDITAVDTVQTGAYTLTVGGTVPNVAEVIALPSGGAKLGSAPSRATRGKPRPH